VRTAAQQDLVALNPGRLYDFTSSVYEKTNWAIDVITPHTSLISTTSYTSDEIDAFNTYFQNYNELLPSLEWWKKEHPLNTIANDIEMPVLDINEYQTIFYRDELLTEVFESYPLKAQELLDKLYIIKQGLGKFEMIIKTESN
jgi:hypothetical protein